MKRLVTKKYPTSILAALIFFSAFAGWRGYASFQHRMNNWDAIGYGAAALNWIEDDSERAHHRIYTDAASAVGPDGFRGLIEGES